MPSSRFLLPVSAPLLARLCSHVRPLCHGCTPHFKHEVLLQNTRIGQFGVGQDHKSDAVATAFSKLRESKRSISSLGKSLRKSR
eukprot:CAMPEP_0115754852 /NCGR_PEP_ID=MMETSP0272-20121206/97082_1 /TAXON_ID=71861 /ORGANISM="Scrippsiella trochoidea, Strain CCMP3099" /LENGTH=83 /DNA_ID=CAMNT_0003200269 /DNA_START=325 /DNA_END=572 /DNA_ORIENTATION=+